MELKFDLVNDYRTNVELYPKFHRSLREREVPLFVVQEGETTLLLVQWVRKHINAM